jgi:hypothetical protein
VPPRAGWHEARVTLLDVTFGDTGFHARWEYLRCDCGDVMVRLEQSAPDGVLTGELLLVEGKVIAARGLVAQAADLELMLQAPTLMLHLAFGLLQRSVPGGPGSVTERNAIAVQEPERDLEIDSGLSTGRFGAPWTVAGEVRPSGAAQRRFELALTFANPQPGDPERRDSIRFSGGQDFARDGFPLRDESSLAGWSLQWISRGETQPSPAPEDLTLGALRAEAEAAATAQAAASEAVGDGLHETGGEAHGAAHGRRQIEGA